jgi:hypothetical protein
MLPSARMRALRGAAASFLLFFIVGLVLAWPALRWPMVYDDLHLLRTFAPEERARAWWGSWDPDGIEHPGLRPLTVLFNEARYRVFGENVAAHRLFLVVLFAVYASLLVSVARSLGVPAPAAIAAGLFLLCSRYSVYHYTWLTDGNHLLQGLLFALAALFLSRGLRRRSWPWPAASVAAFAGAVLVREDSLALVPVLLLFGFVAAPERRALRGYAVALLAVSLALFLYRSLAVPGAPPPGIDVKSFLLAAGRALNLVGPESFDGPSRVLARTWDAAAVLVVAILLFRRRRIDARTPLVFLAASVLACTPALTFRRDDMLFFPVSFAALFYGSALWALARDHPALRVVAAVLFASGVLGGAYASRAFALNFHPDSARAIRWNAQMLYGAYAERATIPAERRAALERQLAAQGIGSAADLPGLGSRIGRARSNGPFRPVAPSTLFFPPLPENDF